MKPLGSVQHRLLGQTLRTQCFVQIARLRLMFLLNILQELFSGWVLPSELYFLVLKNNDVFAGSRAQILWRWSVFFKRINVRSFQPRWCLITLNMCNFDFVDGLVHISMDGLRNFKLGKLVGTWGRRQLYRRGRLRVEIVWELKLKW